MEGDIWKRIKITPELMASMVSRDSFGNRVIIDWGTPDAEEFSEPTFTVDYTDNVAVKALVALRAVVANAQAATLGMNGGVQRQTVLEAVDKAILGTGRVAQ